jgi:uncharacterized protein (TIGR02611 family)
VSGGAPDTEQPERREPKLVQRLRLMRATHRNRNFIVRGAFVVGGVTVLLLGLAMLVTPGPAFVFIPLGLAILSLEFLWAERLLERALEQADAAKRKAAAASPMQKRLTAIATALGVGAAVAAAVLYDIPYLPV